ncbi:MAG: hypothetical protein WC327_02270 [Candidatus Cloacimonadia bacterium]
MSNNTPLLSWESFPLRENPKRSIVLILILLGVFTILWLVTIVVWQTPFYYILGVVFILFDLLPYFIPTHYDFYEEKIVIDYKLTKAERKYSDFRCFYADKQGVMLSTFVQPRWLDRFRGQSIRFSKDQTEREELMALLKKKIGKQV